LNEDEILKETTINNLKDLLLELDEFPLLKKEFENKLNSFKILIMKSMKKIILMKKMKLMQSFSVYYIHSLKMKNRKY
jgi:hypothetical protein